MIIEVRFGYPAKNSLKKQIFPYLQERAEELHDRKETLKKELEKAGHDKEDLKTTYNNYFLQVQTLINQKAIEAPGNKKSRWKNW
jgi:hypothetical protein